MAFSNLSAQNSSVNFFNLFDDLKTPFIIDEIQHNLFLNDSNSNLKKINYNDFLKHSFFEEDGFQAHTFDDPTKIDLYAIGRYKNTNQINCLIILMNEKVYKNNHSEIILLFYNHKNQLINSNTISLILSKKQNNFSSLLFTSKGIFVNKADLDLFTLSSEYAQFNFANEISDSLKLDRLEFNNLKRKQTYKNIDFDKTFFVENHNYLDLIFFKSFILSDFVTNVDNKKPLSVKSYFIDQLLLEDDKKIILFKTDYLFQGYKQYSVVGYHIISNDGKYNKNVGISRYVVPDSGKSWINKASIKIEDNSIVIKYNNGFENVIDKFQLKK